MPSPDSPVRRFFGFVLTTIGILMAFVSGACSLVVLSTGSVSELGTMLSVTLLVGGIPFVVGVLLILLGRWLIRTSQPPADTVF